MNACDVKPARIAPQERPSKHGAPARSFGTLSGGFDEWVEAGLSVDDLPVIGTAQRGEPQVCIDNVP
jgi:hypothetical protein